MRKLAKLITLDAKSKNLKLKLKVECDGVTKEIFLKPGNALYKRLQAVCIGLRSELTMFLLEVEKEIEFKE